MSGNIVTANVKTIMNSSSLSTEHSNLINLWLEASNSSLPHTTNNNDRRNKTTPGWNEHVKEHKKYAKQCHYEWLLAGKPREGPIAYKKRSSRLKFHYAIRYVNKENIRLRNTRMGEAVAKNDDRSLPHTTNNNDRRNKTTPGWNEHVKEHKKYAKQCHYEWLQAGKPREGPIAYKKRSSRLKFHYAIRYVN